MKINVLKSEKEFTVCLEGRLDSNTAPDLENELRTEIDGLEKLTFDFTGLEYISSAGLRVLLASQKKMNKSAGTMIIKNASEQIVEVFEITGMINVFTLE